MTRSLPVRSTRIPAFRATAATLAASSGSDLLLTSARASLPLCALLKWLTTVRCPSACSASTLTRTAPSSRRARHRIPIADRPPTRRRRSRPAPARARVSSGPPALAGRAVWRTRTIGTPVPDRRPGAARTVPIRQRVGPARGPRSPRSAIRRRGRHRAPRCSGRSPAASVWSSEWHCARSRRPVSRSGRGPGGRPVRRPPVRRALR